VFGEIFCDATFGGRAGFRVLAELLNKVFHGSCPDFWVAFPVCLKQILASANIRSAMQVISDTD
jgi:hypothetical protein